MSGLDRMYGPRLHANRLDSDGAEMCRSTAEVLKIGQQIRDCHFSHRVLDATIGLGMLLAPPADFARRRRWRVVVLEQDVLSSPAFHATPALANALPRVAHFVN